MPEQYNKPALTFEQQLQLLQQRGLQVTDTEDALRKLAAISYYRLSGYSYSFRQRDVKGKAGSHFVSGATFDQVIVLYEFDRCLRSLVMDAIERIEVAVRTRLTYHIGRSYGAFGHVDSANFHPSFKHAIWLNRLEREVSRSSDAFIRHYEENYYDFPRLPIWMLTEVMSFGALSIFFKGLRNDLKTGVQDKKAVADYFSLHPKRLGDWLHTLTYVRNVCAHHNRLWNRELAIRPDKVKQANWLPPLTPRRDRVFYVLLMICYLLDQLEVGESWSRKVTELLKPIALVDAYRHAMGMPENWQEHPIWK